MLVLYVWVMFGLFKLCGCYVWLFRVMIGLSFVLCGLCVGYVWLRLKIASVVSGYVWGMRGYVGVMFGLFCVN